MYVPNSLLSLSFIALLSSCAAVTQPQGGPKDEKKPELVKATPHNGSLNFKGKTLILTFNEDVQSPELNKQLIITPNTGNAYSIKNDRRTIELTFDKDLEENTTYLLDFREGIEDITEGNKAENLRIAFSTGPALDSGRVSGTVTDYISTKPESNMTIALYPETDTANIRSKAPYYFTQTSSAGTYSLQNIRPGNYWIFAHHDKNNNQVYDQQNEKIGYLPQPITIGAKPAIQDLKTVLVDTKKPFVVSVLNFTDKNTLVYNEGIRQLEFKSVESPQQEIKLTLITQANGKNMDVYPEAGNLPPQVIAFSTDSSFNSGIDTVKFNLTGKPAIPAKLQVKLKKDQQTIQPGEKIELEFPVPIQITKPQPFTIIEDSVKQTKPDFPGQYTFNAAKTVLTINIPITAKRMVELKGDTTAIQSINGKAFSKINLKIGVQALAGKGGEGSLSGIVKTNYTSYTLELYDEQGKQIKSLTNIKTFNFQNLKPGNYSMLVKIDENNNGRWETGDKKLKQMPEKLYRYPKPLVVRANWDVEDLVLQF
jgi:uncharacterized protein (DUF2141 family)